MTFGERLKYLIEERNITQREVSDYLHIALSTLNGYVNDYREPDFVTLCRLSSFFDVSTDYLLGLTDVPSHDSVIPDQQFQILLSYYTKLNPQMQNLLIDEAKLLIKYNNADET